MLKKITVGYLIFLNVILFAQNSNTILWRISGKNMAKPSYVFGTIHIKDKRVFQVNDSIFDYIQNCDAFACELHPDSLNALVFSTLNKKDTSDAFKKSLNSKEYDAINKKLQNDLGLSLNQIKSKNYKFLKLLLNPLKQKSDDYPTFLDGYLMAIAKRKNREIVGLENTRSQEEGINSINNQEEQKKEIIDLSKDNISNDVTEELIKLYLSGKIDRIQENTSLLSYEVQHDLIYIRNRTMAYTIDSIIKTKPLFATCGAAHLGGDNGIIQLLKDMGYTLTPVFSDKKTYLTLKNLPQNFDTWQTITSNNLGFKYQLPGAPVFYSQEIMYAGMQMYVDITSGSSYIIMPFSSVVDVTDKQKIYSKFLETIKKKAYGEVLKTNKPITYNGSEGIEVQYKASSQADVKLRLFIENNILYTFLVTYPSNNIDTEESNHFFNSIVFSKPVNSNVFNYSNKPWGLVIDLPEKPFEKTDHTNVDNTRIEILTVKSSDNILGIHYLLQFTEAGAGRYYTNDSVVLNRIHKHFSGNKNLVSITDSLFVYQGSRCQQTIAQFDDQSTVVNWTMLRGFKLYNLMAIMSKNILDKKLHEGVFRSIKFSSDNLSDFKIIKSPVDSSLLFNLPQEFANNNSEDTINEGNSDKNPLYRSFDPKTGITYYLEKHEESDYYYTISDSATWKNIENRIVSYSDTLLSVKDFPLKKVHAKEFIIKPKNSTIITHHVVLDFGKFQYDFYSYLPEKDSNARNLYPFVNIEYSKIYKSEFTSDTTAFRKLLTDAFSKDTIIKDKSRSEFYSFKFNNNMFGQIKEILNSPDFPIDTSGQNQFDVKYKLINNLNDLNSDLTIDFVREKLYSNTTEKEYLPQYAKVLAGMKTIYATVELEKFFKTHLSDLNKYSSSFYNIKDSLELSLILFPTVLEAFSKDTSENYSLINLTKILLDTGLLKYEMVKPYEEKIAEQSRSYQSQKSDSKYIFDSYYNDNILAILNHSLNKTFIYNHCNELCKSKNSWCAYYGTYYLLKNDQPVNSKLILSFAKTPYFRNYLCNDYREIKRLDAFPEKYKNQLSFAEADLYSYAYNADEIELTKTEFVSKKNIKYKGKDAEFYFFKIKYEGDDNFYLGITGPYYIGEALDNNGAKTGIFYDEAYSKTLEEEYLEKYLEE